MHDACMLQVNRGVSCVLELEDIVRTHAEVIQN